MTAEEIGPDRSAHTIGSWPGVAPAARWAAVREHGSVEAQRGAEAREGVRERVAHPAARDVHEGRGDLRDELLEAEPRAQRGRRLSALFDQRAQAEQRRTHDDQEHLQREGPFLRQGDSRAGGAPHRDAGGEERGGQEGEARAARAEADRRGHQERHQEGKGRERSARQVEGAVVGLEHQPADGQVRRGEQDSFRQAARSRLAQPAACPTHDHDGGGYDHELAQDVREEATDEDEPHRLASNRVHGRRVGEARDEGRDQHRAGNEHDHAPERVEAGRLIAPVVDQAGRQDRLRAVRGEPDAREEEGSASRQLCREMRGGHGEQHQPEAAGRHQQERCGQDRVGRPQDGRRGRREAQLEAEKRSQVIRRGHAHESQDGRGRVRPSPRPGAPALPMPRHGMRRCGPSCVAQRQHGSARCGLAFAPPGKISANFV